MRRSILIPGLAAAILVAACTGSGTGSPAAPGASEPAASMPAESMPAESMPAESAPASGGAGVDPNSVSGDLVLQGWSAGAVEAPILEQVLDDFMAAYPNVKVTFEPIANDYAGTMAAKFGSGDVPDVFYVDSGPAATWIDDGVLEPLDPYIQATGFDTSAFYPAYLDAFKGPDGMQYGLPKDGNTIAIAYNPDLFEQAGITAPPTTWEELDAAITALQGVEGIQAPMCLPASLDRTLAFIYQAGGGLFNEDMSAGIIDSPESVAGIEKVLGWFQSGAAKRFGDMGDDWCGKSLGDGDVAMAFEGGWLDPYMSETYPDTPYAWAEMPAGAGGQATLGFTVAYAMGVDSQNKDASWALISYLTGPEGMGTWTEGGVANPARTDLPGAAGKEILVQGAEYAHPWSFIPGFTEINDAYNNALTGAIEGSGTAQDVANATKAAIDANLQ